MKKDNKVVETVRAKLKSFIDFKKLSQTFSIFKKDGLEFIEVEDSTFPPYKDRDQHIKTVKSGKTTKQVEVLRIGLDTEYQENNGLNDIISYQIYIPAYKLGVILYNDKKSYERLELKTFIEMMNEVFNHRKLYKELDIISHFSVAEMNSFAKYKEFVKDNHFEDKIQMIQKSFVTVDTVDYSYYTRSKHEVSVKFNISDTWLMSGKESLKSITSADTFKINKIELTKDQITNMKSLLKNNKELFDKYSIIDSYLTAEYYNQYYDTLKKEFNLEGRILTASSISAKVFQGTFKEELDDLIGQYDLKVKRQVKTRNGEKTITQTVKRFHRGVGQLKDSYYGGRNETFCSGVSKDTSWGDYDLKSAYPTALLGFQDINWQEKVGVTTESLRHVAFNDIGMVTLKFKFKDGVPFPGFPIKDETTGGLVFVQEGETTIPLQELYMAYNNDMLDMSSTTIINGYKFQRKNSLKISGFVTDMIIRRDLFPKNTLENKYYKLINNSLYGKFTQGVEEKNILDFFNSTQEEGDFNYSDLEYNQQRRSPIYNPGIASYITGTVRALVTEQMNHIEANGWAKVISVTTDGYMLNKKLTEEQMLELNTLPFSRWFSVIRGKLLKDNNILELKHYSSEDTQNICVKTRCYWMNDEKAKETRDFSKTLISRGGAQSQGDKTKDLDYMTRLLATASNDTNITINHLTNSIDMLNGKDLVRKETNRALNLDYDLKRMPDVTTAVDEEIVYKNEQGIELTAKRITFATKAYKNYSEYLNIKKSYINYLSTTKTAKAINKLRYVDEMKNFLEYNEMKKLEIKVFNKRNNITRFYAKTYILYMIMKNQINPTLKDIKNYASKLNLTNKQIHNMLRHKVFTEYVLNKDMIITLNGNVEIFNNNITQFEYLFDKLTEEEKLEFKEFLLSKKEEQIEKELNVVEMISFENNEPITQDREGYEEYCEYNLEEINDILENEIYQNIA